MRIVVVMAALVLLVACGSDGGNDDPELTARDGEVASESTWRARFRATIEDSGYTEICTVGMRAAREAVAAGDVGQSTVEDMTRLVAIYTDECDAFARK